MLAPERLDGLDPLGRQTGQPVVPRLVALVQAPLGNDSLDRRHDRTLPVLADTRTESALALVPVHIRLPEKSRNAI